MPHVSHCTDKAATDEHLRKIHAVIGNTETAGQLWSECACVCVCFSVRISLRVCVGLRVSECVSACGQLPICPSHESRIRIAFGHKCQRDQLPLDNAEQATICEQ
ncbi:hypothetical protein NDU88_005443 [Pleurodeles waltl]|uniref:Uncharacterized protein n=1 Tax=Pleurodeles waltl TaxID=8319 RepID=A0AAV7LMP0_PLEWA|nr:hypothetical protein NDU88_005443 [Pleurodeles waltl]